MRHLTVSGFGDFLGVHGNRLIVRNGDNVILEREFPAVSYSRRQEAR